MKTEYGTTRITLSREDTNTIDKFFGIISNLCQVVDNTAVGDSIILCAEDPDYNLGILNEIAEDLPVDLYDLLESVIIE